MDIICFDDGVLLHNEYFTISNGYQARAHNETILPYNDLLAVHLVTRRNKRFMYAALVVGGLVLLAQQLLDTILIALPLLAAVSALIIYTLATVYRFSARTYIEITSMRGTFRVPVPRGDATVQAVVTNLQSRVQ